MRKFSDIIKDLRRGKYTQVALAEELGVSKSTVAMWETDSRLPSRESCEQIADLFNVDIDYIYGRTNIRKKHHFDERGNEYISADHIRENSGYYIDSETIKMAQALHNNKDMKVLFDAVKDVDSDTLKATADFLQKLKER